MYFLISIAELACSDTLCENGGTCTEVDGSPGYMCTCCAGFTGQNCEDGKLTFQNQYIRNINLTCELRYMCTCTLLRCCFWTQCGTGRCFHTTGFTFAHSCVSEELSAAMDVTWTSVVSVQLTLAN